MKRDPPALPSRQPARGGAVENGSVSDAFPPARAVIMSIPFRACLRGLGGYSIAEGSGRRAILHDRIPKTALEWHRAGKRAALATVVETWGSAPRPVGSQLAISGAGEIMGSVSGGCVEAAVVVEALEALEEGAPRLLSFGVSDDEAFAVGLACGGTIHVLVEPVGTGATALSEAVLADLVQAREARRATVALVNLKTWERRILAPEGRRGLAPEGARGNAPEGWRDPAREAEPPGIDLEALRARVTSD